jgi:hypothetical protein
LKIRRRFASGGAITRLLDFLKSRFLPAPPDDDAAESLVPDAPRVGDDESAGTTGTGVAEPAGFGFRTPWPRSAPEPFRRRLGH